MPAITDKKRKGFKSPTRSFAVGVFLLGCLSNSGVALAQASESGVESHNKAVAPRLAAFYRNEFEAPVAGEPFSAVEERITAFRTPDSKLENRSVTTTRISRDSAGRLRVDREIVAYDSHRLASRRTASYVADPVGHSLLILDPEHRAALELPWDAPSAPEPQAQHAQTSDATNDTGDIRVKVEALGIRSLEGQTVDGSLRELSIPIKSKWAPCDRAVVVSIETWISRELNVAVWTRSETSSGEISTTTLKDIIRAEPNRNLFELPTDYVLTSPGADTVFALAR